MKLTEWDIDWLEGEIEAIADEVGNDVDWFKDRVMLLLREITPTDLPSEAPQADKSELTRQAIITFCDVAGGPSTDAEAEKIAAGMREVVALLLAAPEQAPQGEVVAWLHQDDPDRVVSNRRKASNIRDGGGSASSIKPYTIPLFTTPGVTAKAQEDAKDAARYLAARKWLCWELHPDRCMSDEEIDAHFDAQITAALESSREAK